MFGTEQLRQWIVKCTVAVTCSLDSVVVNADPCEQEPVKIAASSGTIYSPGYDIGTYPNNANCQWLIEAPAGKVTLTSLLL